MTDTILEKSTSIDDVTDEIIEQQECFDETLPSILRTMPQSVNFKKLRKRLIRHIRAAMDDYAMVRPGEKWLICISGGKDSMSLLSLLIDLKWRGLLPVDLVAMNLDQGQPGFPDNILPDFFRKHEIDFHIERQDTYSIVKEKVPENKTYCSLCSRFRRAIIYRLAREKGCSTIVLGHHREDSLETFLLNLYYGAKLAAMPPKLLNEDKTCTLIRPLSYCAEEDIAKYAAALKFPIIPCDLCGSQDGLQRQQMKQLLASWESTRPGTKMMMMKAMANIRPSQLLDKSLFDFTALTVNSEKPGD